MKLCENYVELKGWFVDFSGEIEIFWKLILKSLPWSIADLFMDLHGAWVSLILRWGLFIRYSNFNNFDFRKSKFACLKITKKIAKFDSFSKESDINFQDDKSI